MRVKRGKTAAMRLGIAIVLLTATLTACGGNAENGSNGSEGREPVGSGVNEGADKNGGSGVSEGADKNGGSEVSEGADKNGGSEMNEGAGKNGGSGVNEGADKNGGSGVKEGTGRKGESEMEAGTGKKGGGKKQGDGAGGTALVKPEETAQVMLNGEYARLYEQFSQELQQAVTLADFKGMGEFFLQDIEAFQSPTVLSLNGMERYVWMNKEETKSLIASYDQEGTIIGIQIQPVTSYPESDAAKTKLSYGLPFKGEWLVFWGGDNEMHNYHYAIEGQRYAYDLIMAKDEYSFNGDPALNESYYAFGQAMLAPGDGKVVIAVNDIADNEPVGTMNSSQPAGNYVVIDHGNGEFSYLAHLQQGSVKVKKGERVKKGQEIGLCGNSGNSSEPHLHFQVSDGPDLFTSKAISVTFDGDVEMIQGDYRKGGE
ncbi:hypothetical protein PAECIP111893_02779 [Paenibacillus plantiphilus]|uniref:M23ase beta-sheet core domain-containing protein n=1 Tax=Paenibacillus plantiphilus TaxID=2905650 RepID=A0ABN8GFH0_9BACL|nr:peptidoglycan DD-metalloendopeptidase family protein [Paenibacillus plantiphilus]CAH1207781.1 hypothetical protein PAECIP111893_02779 [Paenibacillus plantiphilus]